MLFPQSFFYGLSCVFSKCMLKSSPRTLYGMGPYMEIGSLQLPSTEDEVIWVKRKTPRERDGLGEKAEEGLELWGTPEP